MKSHIPPSHTSAARKGAAPACPQCKSSPAAACLCVPGRLHSLSGPGFHSRGKGWCSAPADLTGRRGGDLGWKTGFSAVISLTEPSQELTAGDQEHPPNTAPGWGRCEDPSLDDHLGQHVPWQPPRSALGGAGGAVCWSPRRVHAAPQTHGRDSHPPASCHVSQPQFLHL